MRKSFALLPMLLGMFGFGPPALAQVRICDLPAATVADTLYFEASANCSGSRKVSWGQLKSNLNLSSYALASTTITCSPPLLCAGGASHDLSSGFTLSIADGTANQVLAAPSGASGAVSLRALVAADLPAATTAARGAVELATDGEVAASLAVQANDGRLSNARTPTAHTHAASDVNSGTLAAARLPAATTSAQGAVELATDGEVAASLAVQANDGRLSNARTPTAHTHAAADIASGTIATARLGSGTADSTKFLRGDQTWAVPAGGGGSVGVTETDGVLVNPATLIEFQEIHFNVAEPVSGTAYITLGTHTALQHSGNVLPGAAQSLGATYLDASDVAAPASPAAGTRRIFVNQATGAASVKRASGKVLSLEEAISGRVLSRDTFAAADGTALTSHTPNTGPTWQEGTGGTAGYTIQGGQMSRADNVIRHAFFDAGTPNVRVTVNVTHLENLVGLLVRRGSTAQYWEVFYDWANSGWQMSLVNGGGDVFKGPLLPGGTGTITLEAKGNSITAIGPGGDSHTEIDPTLNGNTQVGIIVTGFSGVASTVDDWHVEDAAGYVITPSVNQDLGDGYLDVGDRAAPSNPAAGVRRLFVDQATGKLSVRTSAGSTVSLEEQGGGGSLTVREVDGSPSVASVTTIEALQPLLVVSNPSAGVARIARADPWSVLELTDDFLPSSTETGEIGALSWSNVSSSASVLPAEDGHPGIIQISTPGTSAAIRSIHLGGAVSTQVISPADVERVLWIGRRVAGDQMMVRIGLLRDASDTGGGTDGVFFRFDNTDGVTTQWLAVTRAAGVETVTNTSVAATAATWFQLELVRLSNGNWEFWINGTLRATHSTNIPTAGLNIVAAVETREALAKRIDVDAFYMRSKVLGQRWQ